MGGATRERPNTKLVTLDGVTRSVREWALAHGMEPAVLHMRLNGGLDLKTALAKPVKPRRSYPKRRRA